MDESSITVTMADNDSSSPREYEYEYPAVWACFESCLFSMLVSTSIVRVLVLVLVPVGSSFTEYRTAGVVIFEKGELKLDQMKLWG